MTTNSIKTIIFDFGGVLINWDPRNLYRHYFPGQPQAMEAFLKEVGFYTWNAQQDKGRPFKEGVAKLTAKFPHHAELIEAYHHRWEESITGSIKGSVSLLEQLAKKGTPLYGLSNWSTETFPLVEKEYPFFGYFDEIILSGEVKLIKPDRAIFDLLLAKINLPAEAAIFIDDSAANIHTAQEMGFNTVHFTSPEMLESALKEYGAL